MSKQKHSSLSDISPSIITLHEAMDACGRYYYEDSWQDGQWKEALYPEKNAPAYLESLGPEGYKANPVDIERYAKSHKIYKKMAALISEGVLPTFYGVGVETRNIELEKWKHKTTAIQYFEDGNIYRLSKVKRKEENRKKGSINIRRDDFEKYVGIVSNHNEKIRPSKGKAGRPTKYPYGKFTAILWAIIEEEGALPSQDQMAKRIVDVYQAIWPDDEIPDIQSLENNILREFYTHQDSVRKKLKKN